MESSSFFDRLVENASQNAVLMRAKFLNILKKQMKSASSKNCIMNVKCGCNENNFNVLVTEGDIEKVYDRFAKKCPSCGEAIKITFKFN
ncbi:MAG: hypothetical protein M1276_08365 [Deltaproteobacteria bacterium]|jgi:hypothetical protein|nr:hypothetical protein [Deltaproteobacteria bacterium]